MIKLKRVYEAPAHNDGARFLVERLWPRGVSKEKLAMDAWEKDVGPSDRLRKWFSHDPAKWDKFREKYFEELDARPEAWTPILQSSDGHTVTLLYSSRDTEHNNAVALKEYLDRKLATG
ncbi:MAG TPA: DUF488 family protein [Bryobacteraceae bacterium]|jgi:uncharacterized protein YeaO (DUF488 family)